MRYISRKPTGADGSVFSKKSKTPKKVDNVNMTDWRIYYATNTESATDDTNDYPEGDHSVKIVTKGQGNVNGGISNNSEFAPIDLSKATGCVYIKVDDWDNVRGIRLVSRENGGASYPTINLHSITGWQKQNNEWMPVYFNFVADDTTSSATHSSVTRFYIKVTDMGQPLTVWVGNIKIFNAQDTGSLSIVFDDGHISVLEAEKIMSNYGLYPSLAIIPDYVDSDDSDWLSLEQVRSLEDKGWEIITHHSAVHSLTDTERKNIITRNSNWMKRHKFAKWVHWVHPSGFVNNQLVEDLKEVGYLSARSITNHGQSAGIFDNYRINAWSVHNTTSLSDITDWIDKHVSAGSHAVLVLHRVADTPTESTEISKSNLEAICQHILDNNINVVPYSHFASGLE